MGEFIELLHYQQHNVVFDKTLTSTVINVMIMLILFFRWKIYEHLWLLNQESEVENFIKLSPTLVEFDAKLNLYTQIVEELQNSDLNVSIGCLCLDLQKIITQIRKWSIEWKKVIVDHFLIILRKEMIAYQDKLCVSVFRF